jgi:uncharacterized protein
LNTFFDTSALIKLYVRETGSEYTLSTWVACTTAVVSAIAHAEVIATLQRKVRHGWPADQCAQAANAWGRHLQFARIVSINYALNTYVSRVCETYALRGADALQLASALMYQSVSETMVAFCAADRQLIAAAHSEGLVIVDVSHGV